jgi:HTH-type transcriptional regulator/antitoxin HigA
MRLNWVHELGSLIRSTDTFRMDQLGMTCKDLEAVLGGYGRVSEILTKKRTLSLEMIRRLHRTAHIPLESLIGTVV